jgi:glutaredoxin-like YruB-family protein
MFLMLLLDIHSRGYSMGEKKATVYSAAWCPWCHKAIDFLKENNVKVEVKDVGENPDFAKEVVEKTGQSGIPVIVIGEEVIVGFNQPKIKEALGSSEEKKEEKPEEEKTKE